MASVAKNTSISYTSGGDPEYIAKLVHRMGEDYYSAKYGEKMDEGAIHEITIAPPIKPFVPQPKPTNIANPLRVSKGLNIELALQAPQPPFLCNKPTKPYITNT